MKHKLFAAFAAIALFLTPLTGQQAQQVTEYRVITQGMNLWDLAESTYGDAQQWRMLYDRNVEAGLLDPNRLQYRNGEPIVILSVGQRLLLTPQEAQKAGAIVKPVPTGTPAIPPTRPITTRQATSDFWFWAFWALFAISAIGFFLLFRKVGQLKDRIEMLISDRAYRDERSSNRIERLEQELAETRRVPDPAETFSDLEIRAMAMFPRERSSEEGEGPSFINGGIKTSGDLELALQRSAQMQAVHRNPDGAPVPHTEYRFRHGTRVRVISGTYSTYFADGSRQKRVVERDKPETHRIAWRAMSVAPDGTETPVYAEEICGNGMAIAIAEAENIEWEELPNEAQNITLPESAIYHDPEPEVIEAVLEEIAATETTPMATFRTPDGTIINVPVGSTLLDTTQVPNESRTE